MAQVLLRGSGQNGIEAFGNSLINLSLNNAYGQIKNSTRQIGPRLVLPCPDNDAYQPRRALFSVGWMRLFAELETSQSEWHKRK
jgi:hypothetical protein